MNEKKDGSSGEEKRLPYEKPAVISEEVFETMALSCVKANVDECGPFGVQS